LIAEDQGGAAVNNGSRVSGGCGRMAPVDGLTEFLQARLAEDEQVAQAATPGPWSAGEYYPDVWEINGPTHNIAWESRDGDIGRGDATHIVRWDPARVLAEVQAKRRIIEAVQRRRAGHPGRHESEEGVELESGLDFQLYGPCARCDEWNRTTLPIYAARLLAPAYAEHPGYRPEWAPTEEGSRGQAG
jgi:hypothetical protein